MYLLKPFSIIQRDCRVRGWLLWTSECFRVLVTGTIQIGKVHPFSCSWPWLPPWAETLKPPQAKGTNLHSLPRGGKKKNQHHRALGPFSPLLSQGGVLWDRRGRCPESRKPRGRPAAGKVDRLLSLASGHPHDSVLLFYNAHGVIFF